jgi:hypothetical protein
VKTRALIAAAKIFDFYGSPRRAGSQGSPKRCFSVGKAAEKTNFIVFSYFYNYPKSKNMKG